MNLEKLSRWRRLIRFIERDNGDRNKITEWRFWSLFFIEEDFTEDGERIIRLVFQGWGLVPPFLIASIIIAVIALT